MCLCWQISALSLCLSVHVFVYRFKWCRYSGKPCCDKLKTINHGPNPQPRSANQAFQGSKTLEVSLERLGDHSRSVQMSQEVSRSPWRRQSVARGRVFPPQAVILISTLIFEEVWGVKRGCLADRLKGEFRKRNGERWINNCAGTALVHSGDTKRPFNLPEISIKAYYPGRQTPNGNKGHFFCFFPLKWGWSAMGRNCSVPLTVGEGPAGGTGLTWGLLIALTARLKLRLEPQNSPKLCCGGCPALPDLQIGFPRLNLDFLHHWSTNCILAPHASVSPAAPILPEFLPCLGAGVRINN